MFFRFWLVCSLLFSTSAFAGVMDVDGFGLSYHLGGSYAGAPRGLDPNGKLVFNPGVGVGYDFRDKATKSGFSPMMKMGFFQDCNDISFFYAVGGARYSYFIGGGDYSIGGTLGLGILNGADWSTGDRSFNLMVLPILEVGRRIYKDNVLRLGMVVTPKNTAMTATSGGSLLFFMISYGITF